MKKSAANPELDVEVSPTHVLWLEICGEIETPCPSIEDILEGLTEHEHEIITLLYGLEDGYMLSAGEVAATMKTSSRSVYEIKTQALRKLRAKRW